MLKQLSTARFAFGLFFLLIIAGCKKNNSTAAGNWQFADYSSSATYYQRYNNYDTVINTVRYNAAGKAIVYATRRSAGQPANDTTVYPFAYSNWNIMSNGTYTIAENADSLAGSTTGSWEYLSSNTVNNAITFENGGSLIFQFIQSSSQATTLNIQSVSSNKLVLTYNTSSSDSTGNFSTVAATVTFTK